jgi:hypothetical protein
MFLQIFIFCIFFAQNECVCGPEAEADPFIVKMKTNDFFKASRTELLKFLEEFGEKIHSKRVEKILGPGVELAYNKFPCPIALPLLQLLVFSVNFSPSTAPELGKLTQKLQHFVK